MRLVIDISGLAYRSAHKLKLSDLNGTPTNLVFGVLRSLQHIAELIEPEEIIICWDRGYTERTRLYPEYKANRKRDPEFKEDFDRQMGVLREVMRSLPFTQVEEPGVEADDCIAALCKFMQHEQVGIVTGDRDLYQLAKGGRKKQHVIFDYDGVPAKLEFTPSGYITYKVLVGDSSDNIKGVEGLGDKTARALMREHKTLKAIMAASKRDGTKLGRMTYKQAMPIVKRNLQLMRLDNGGLLTDEQRVSIVRQYRDGRVERLICESELREHFKALGFKSFLRRFSKFLLDFRKLERKPRGRTTAVTHGKEEVHPPRKASAKPHAGKDRQSGSDKGVEPKQWRKVRRVVKRWRRVRRVVGEARRPKGSERRDAAEGEGGQASPVGGCDDLGTKLDPQDGHRRAEGAVSVVVRQARASRARARSKRVPAVQEVSQPKQVRRERALSMLSSFKHDMRWLTERPVSDLQRVHGLIKAFEEDQAYSPSEDAVSFLGGLCYEYGMEMPEWMLSGRESGQRRKRKRKNRRRNAKARTAL